MEDKDPVGLEGRDHLGRFVAGNKWCKLKGIFQTTAELQSAIEEYFEMSKQKNGVYKPTINGLCFHCGFDSRQSFYDYENRPEFAYYVKRARLFIHSCYEANLYGFAWGGASFALKNLDKWTDEVVQHQKIESVKADFGTGEKKE